VKKMRFGVIALAVLLTSPALTGCTSSEGDFQWPEPIADECSFEDSFELNCSDYLSGFSDPIMSIKHPIRSEIWIVELSGFIRSWDGSVVKEVADMSSIVSRCHMEQGLLGIAFGGSFEETGNILFSYVEDGSCDGPNKSDLVLAYAQEENDGRINLTTLQILFRIEQPFRNHNGGHILSIGNDQFLWGVGDGGGSFDPNGNGQDPGTPLGSIYLFSFVDGEIIPVIEEPIGDPFVLHYGLRNPWRFDLDLMGRLWIADVGQGCWEEVNIVQIDSQKNLGWPVNEGSYVLSKDGCEDQVLNHNESLVDPIVAYSHEGGDCSITGGFWMSWGPEILNDGYLYGDFCSGSIWILRNEDGVWEEEYVGKSGSMIVGFGRGLSDELLLFDWRGRILQIY